MERSGSPAAAHNAMASPDESAPPEQATSVRLAASRPRVVPPVSRRHDSAIDLVAGSERIAVRDALAVGTSE